MQHSKQMSTVIHTWLRELKQMAKRWLMKSIMQEILFWWVSVVDINLFKCCLCSVPLRIQISLKDFELHPVSIWFMVHLSLGFLEGFSWNSSFCLIERNKEAIDCRIACLVYLEKMFFLFYNFKNVGQYYVLEFF